MKESDFQKFQSGNEKVLRQVFDRYFEPLTRYALYLTKDKESAKDIAVVCISKLWDIRESIDYPTFEAYLFTSAKNRALNYIRDNRHKNSYYEELEKIPEAPSQEYLEKDQFLINSLIDSAVENLPQKCKQVFLLAKDDGLTYREIAYEMNITVKTVERQMNIAFKKLRAELSPYLHILYG